jgi:very-short-patch-repair endonuclease
MPRFQVNSGPSLCKGRLGGTDAERALWSKIRLKQLNGYQFYRQKAIRNYIVDFYSAEAKLVIEVDGAQHYTDEILEKDKRRDKHLNNLGLKVLRFNDLDVLTNINGVIESIMEYLKLNG